MLYKITYKDEDGALINTTRETDLSGVELIAEYAPYADKSYPITVTPLRTTHCPDCQE